MTTIAYTHGYLAADRLMTAGDTIVSNRTSKIYVGRDRSSEEKLIVLVGSGLYTNIIQTFDFVINGSKPGNKSSINFDLYPEQYQNDFEVWVFHEDDGIYLLDKSLIKQPIFALDDRYIAMGSGTQAALAAMICGKNATEAVIVASKLDVFTGSGTIRGINVWEHLGWESNKWYRPFVKDEETEKWI